MYSNNPPTKEEVAQAVEKAQNFDTSKNEVLGSSVQLHCKDNANCQLILNETVVDLDPLEMVSLLFDSLTGGLNYV